MASIFDGFAKQIFTGDTVKDWSHASQIFVTNNYERAPKYGFLYHVHIEVNPDVGVNPVDKQNLVGLMVKSVTLPKFNVDTKVLNAYGHPMVNQTRLGYEPITIVFHDDSADIVRSFWNRYQQYYYANNRAKVDSDQFSKLSSRQKPYATTKDFITAGERGFAPIGSAEFLKSIRVFSFFNKKFSTFLLVNPIIKSFSFGDHRYAEGTSTLESTMTVEYEAALYQGVRPNVSSAGNNNLDAALETAQFTLGPYDKTPSPLLPAGGGTRSILGQGGIADGISSAVDSFRTGDLTGGLLTAGRLLQTNQGVDLKALAKTEGTQILREGTKSILSNKNSPINLPTFKNPFK